MPQNPASPAHTAIVLDFETTGLSPGEGDRAIEIGAVLLRDGEIVARFQELMNPGFRISPFIADYTGITNEMLAAARPCHEVMARFADFVGDHHLVAHNASFDGRFLDAELQRIRRRATGSRACSMLVARRVYPHAPNHKLGTLVAYKGLATQGVFHRALADAEMTADLWNRMLGDISSAYGIAEVPFSLMVGLCRKPKAQAHRWLVERGQAAGPG